MLRLDTLEVGQVFWFAGSAFQWDGVDARLLDGLKVTGADD